MGSFISIMYNIICGCSCCIDNEDEKSQTNSDDGLIDKNPDYQKPPTPHPYSSLFLEYL